jgi:signal transduction histidine kinase
MGIRILLIDDSPIDRELARNALRGLSVPPGPVELVSAGDLAEAMPHLVGQHFDLMLLDFNLPGRSGLEILRALDPTKRPPVVMTTGQQDVATAVETLRAGAHDYVVKSADWGLALCMTVERVLTRVRLERELAESRRRLAAYAAELEEKVEARTALVKAQAAEIEGLYLKAEEAARLKAEIVANVSHEMRTPLNVMLGYAELLEGRLTEELPAALDMLGRIQSQTGHLHRLIESLLALGRLNAGAEGVVRVRFPISWLGEELKRDAASLNEKALSITWQLDSGDVVHDRDKVRMILYHLLSNAIKFTHVGRVDVTIAPTPAGGLRLVVGDTGIGLSAEAREVVFDDFRQLDGSSTRQFQGLGLGLGIVKRYVELLRGTIAVESLPDQGTRFTVELPRLDAVENRPSQAPTSGAAVG